MTWINQGSGEGPGYTGGGQDVSGPGHGRLGPRPGDGRGARGDGGPGRFGGRDAGRKGDGERPDEGVACPYGVDGWYTEAFDDLRGVGVGWAGSGGCAGWAGRATLSSPPARTAPP